MNCSKCQYLNLKDEKEGKVSGKKYWCQLKREYIRANDNCCEKITKNEKLSKEIINKIEKEGKEYYNDNTPIEIYILLITVLIILGLIMDVFKF